MSRFFLWWGAEHDSTGHREGNEDAWRASDQRRGTPGVDYLTYILVKVLLVIIGEGSHAHVAAVCRVSVKRLGLVCCYGYGLGLV